MKIGNGLVMYYIKSKFSVSISESIQNKVFKGVAELIEQETVRLTKAG